MAGHRAGVTQGEVDQLVAVEVGDQRAVGRREAEGEAAGPLVHPGHGDPSEEVVGARVQGLGGGVVGVVAVPL